MHRVRAGSTSTVLSNLKSIELGRMGSKGGSDAIGPEPDREWLTDAPKGISRSGRAGKGVGLELMAGGGAAADFFMAVPDAKIAQRLN